MRWKEVRERFPVEWVVLEAKKAHSEGGQRYIEDVIVIVIDSASTLLKADIVGEIGLVPEEDGVADTIRGVRGIEYVYTKTLDGLSSTGNWCRAFRQRSGVWRTG